MAVADSAWFHRRGVDRGKHAREVNGIGRRDADHQRRWTVENVAGPDEFRDTRV